MKVYLLSHQKHEPGPTLPIGVYSSQQRAEAQIPEEESWWYDIQEFELDVPSNKTTTTAPTSKG